MEDLHLEGLADATSVYAELVAGLGEYLDGASLVLPDNEHFPDTVDASPDGIRVLFERVLGYTPVRSDTQFELHFVDDDDEAPKAGGCSSGACGPSQGGASPWLLPKRPLEADAHDVWHLVVPLRDVGTPIRLMSQLSRLAGDLLLAQAGLEAEGGAFERAIRAEVAALACGLGPLLLAASHMTVKGCGGLRTFEGTALPTHVLAGLVALFAAQHEQDAALRRAAALSQPTPREALDLARSFFARRPRFVQQLRETPEAVAFHCDFGAEEGLLARWFGARPRDSLVRA